MIYDFSSENRKPITKEIYIQIRIILKLVMATPHQKQANLTVFSHKLTYNTFLVISSSNLSQVTVVVSLHFQIENFTFCLRSIRDQELFQQRLKQKQRT